MNENPTLSITSADGHRVDAVLYPTADPAAPVLLFLSALGTPAKVYRHIGREMASHGVQVCAPDWRGIGSSSVRAGRSSDFGYRHLIEFDLAAWMQALRQRFPHSPLWLGGHSLGGQLALLSAATNTEDVAGVVLIASGSVHLKCYSGKLRLGVRSLVLLSRLLGPLLGYFPGSRLGFGGREAAGLMHDWSHLAVTGDYRPQGSSVDYEQALRRLNVPVLALTFEADAWSPARAARGLLNKLPSGSFVHWHWDKAQTAGIAVDHYSWIKKPELVASAIAQFMLQTPQSAS